MKDPNEISRSIREDLVNLSTLAVLKHKTTKEDAEELKLAMQAKYPDVDPDILWALLASLIMMHVEHKAQSDPEMKALLERTRQ